MNSMKCTACSEISPPALYHREKAIAVCPSCLDRFKHGVLIPREVQPLFEAIIPW